LPFFPNSPFFQSPQPADVVLVTQPLVVVEVVLGVGVTVTVT
jgi:hypothetical protein